MNKLKEFSSIVEPEAQTLLCSTGLRSNSDCSTTSSPFHLLCLLRSFHKVWLTEKGACIMHKDNIGNVLGSQSYICQLKGVQLHTGGKYFEFFLIKIVTFFPCNVLTSLSKEILSLWYCLCTVFVLCLAIVLVWYANMNCLVGRQVVVWMWFTGFLVHTCVQKVGGGQVLTKSFHD